MWQVLVIGTLLALMVARNYFELGVVDGALNPDTLAATGFIILAAFTMGELFRRLKAPALLGYIAAGILFGPDLSALVFGTTETAIFGREVISDLALINILIVGVIGTLGGGELKMSELKSQAPTILSVVGLVFLAVVPASGLAVFLAAKFAPELVPFLADASQDKLIAVCLLFGVIGFAMSPTATLAIMQETRAKGRFTSLTLGTVIVAELAVVATFLMARAFDELLLGPDELTPTLLESEALHIGAEFGWALVIGVVTGLVLIIYLRYVAREMLLFTVGIIFAVSAVATELQAESMLAFIAAGFIVQNFSRHGHTMIHALEKISLPVFVIYFMIAAAELDLQAVGLYLPLALILTGVRTAGLYAGVRAAARLSGAGPVVTDNLWLALLSRGSVDVVLAAMVAKSFPEWGPDFQAVVMAAVILHIIVGPIVLKWVLERVGETEQARKQGSAEAAALDRMVDSEEVPDREPFELPDFEDDALNRKIAQIRQTFVDCHDSCIMAPIDRRGEAMSSIVEQVRTEVSRAIDGLETLAEGDEQRLDRLASWVRDLHAEFRQRLQPQMDHIDRMRSTVVNAQTTGELLSSLRGLVDFEEHLHVPWAGHLLAPSPDDTRTERLFKFLRRIRLRMAGSGSRDVPLGRLWRYYIELSVPGYLASAVGTTADENEHFWYDLGNHLRDVDATFEAIVDTLCTAHRDSAQAEAVQPSMLPMSLTAEAIPAPMEAHDHAEADGGDHEAASARGRDQGGRPADQADPRARVAALADQAKRRLPESTRRLSDALDLLIETTRERYTFALDRAYHAFIDGVAKAGTIELPAYRYRPSSRFDQARRAEARLDRRLMIEASVVDGYQGWIQLDHELVLFMHWFRNYQGRILSSLERLVRRRCLQRLEILRSRCQERPSVLDQGAEAAAEVDWERWFQQQLAPAFDETRQVIEVALSSFNRGVTTRRLMDVLESRVARLPDRLALLTRSPQQAQDDQGGLETLELPLRAWFYSRLARELALRFVEFNERAERMLRRAMIGIDEIEQGVEYSLVATQREADQERFDRQIVDSLERAAELVDKLHDTVDTDEREIRRWISAETTAVARQSTAPFIEHRLAEITRWIARSRGETLAQRRVQPLLRRVRGSWHRTRDFVAQLAEDVRRRLTHETVVPTRAEIRERLIGSSQRTATRVPPIYRRLFSPVPVDIPDFYIDRPGLERECLRAVDAWFDDVAASILLEGERGMGKRTFVHHVLPMRIYSRYADIGEDQLQTIQLAEQIETEADLCRELAPLIGDRQVGSLAAFSRLIERGDRRQIVVLENSEKLYSRTAEGFALAERFGEVVRRTARDVLWIVILDSPATTLLRTAVDLPAYFTDHLQVAPLSDDRIEQLIEARHDTSGFELEFEPPELDLVDRLFDPVRSANLRRNPRRAYFRRLGRLSRGNPLRALLYWLDSVRLDEAHGRRIIVEPLPATEMNLLGPLSLRRRLVLATLTQHHSLTLGELGGILRVEVGELRGDLELLEQLGFVERPRGTPGWRLRLRAEALLYEALHNWNAI